MKNMATASIIVILTAALCNADIKLEGEKTEKTYGSALVAKVIAVDNVYTFRCDVKGWPDVIGSDIPVRINGIAAPLIVAQEGKPNRFFQIQAKKFLTEYLSESKTIDLKNIRRGKDFSIIADVIADSNSLADILIENGLARRITPAEIAKQQRNLKTPRSLAENRQRDESKEPNNAVYVASKNSKVFHKSTCSSARRMTDKTKLTFSGRQQAGQSGRRPCKICEP
jgi:endonuclease YncB( thermonuclease family)